MLYLIGLGIGDENDISFRAIDKAKQCECFLEDYTSVWKGSLPKLEKMIGKPITILGRTDVENKSSELLTKASSNDIAIFVIGDPMAATTHCSLVKEAREKNIPVSVLHNSSIFSAIGETGLQIYKFGKTSSITFTGELANVISTVKDNQSCGAHTLLLLDLKETGECLSAEKAIQMLLDQKIISTDQKIIVAHIAKKSIIKYTPANEIKNIPTPAVIIIPGNLHFAEKEFLEGLK
jgi:diphthine synthase